MELKAQRLLPADRATVWALLNDPEVLRRCIPGCESITANGEHSYDVVMSAAIGPVKARFKGKLRLADIEPPIRYRLLFDGQSSQAGFARGEAQVELQQTSAGQTTLIYAAKSQIGGKLAQIGGRLIDAAAGATADKFFATFAAQLPAPAPPASAPAGPTGLWSRLLSSLRRVFAR